MMHQADCVHRGSGCGLPLTTAAACTCLSVIPEAVSVVHIYSVRRAVDLTNYLSPSTILPSKSAVFNEYIAETGRASSPTCLGRPVRKLAE